MNPETRCTWVPFKRELDKYNNRPRLHYVRIESTVGTGIPDLNLRVGHHDLWLEMKHFSLGLVEPGAARIADMGLRKEQFVWLYNAQKAGRHCGVLATDDFGNWYYWDDMRAWKMMKQSAIWLELERLARFKTDSPSAMLALLW